ncbi:membrane-bound flavoprotein subunit of gluconate 2-dehydrogenase [Rahnella aquatilis CIP 78.65 = ATCC 33071]|jgi:gluconate 2-dehydrogenase alpha chain|uniref:hypothetical protein n=1 Tax=Enterobacterales TaxID=91347 RepID=UPI0002D81D89|nr:MULTISPECIES: hypothetical protein [Enterobacterales]KFD06266.1 membrane-bound flavoprotein subunit of gluconate 2-dehydrogenase [Rahnella aquatilis CIP 78.65 = ATCC 33071]
MDRTNFILLTECTALYIDKAEDGKTVRCVTFLDSDGNTGFQPADTRTVAEARKKLNVAH